MGEANWQIRILDQDGALVAILDRYEEFHLIRQVNGVGSFGILLSGENPKADLFELDGQIEFWRRYQMHDLDWYVEFGGFYRDARWFLDDQDNLQMEAIGLGWNHLLARRIIVGAKAASWEKSDKAETIAKEIVTEQCVTRAALHQFSVQADAANGPNVAMARHYRNVLEVCQEIASIGEGDFAVVNTAAATFQFRWYDGQLGTDRSATVIFATERGNMRRASLSLRRTPEISAVLAGGRELAEDRAQVWSTSAPRIAESNWNRLEAFRDSRMSPDADLPDEGLEMLEAGRPKFELNFEVIQTPSTLYGVDYFLGDLVTARFHGYEATRKVTKVVIDVESRGEGESVEQIQIVTEEV